MIIELSCIVAGIPVGFVLRRNVPVVRVTERLASLVVYVLLFLLGLAIGGNDEIVAGLQTMSLRAFTIAFCAVLGSVLGGMILERCLPSLLGQVRKENNESTRGQS